MDWFPWYAVKYRRKTRHLSDDEDLAYRRLIDEYMISREALPDNDRALAKIVGYPEEQWAACSANVRAYFNMQDGFLHHDFCDGELSKQKRGRKELSARGKRGAEKRWSKQRGNSDSHGTGQPTAVTPAMPEPLPSHSGGYSRGQDSRGEEKEAAAAISSSVSARAGSDAASEIIAVFDAERIAAFGQNHGRPWPNATDHVRAEAFLRDGATAEFCRPVFRAVFQRQKAQNARPADNLAYMAKPIADALVDIPPALRRTASDEGPPISYTEAKEI